ncbi:MAG: cell division protein FtsQ/DivIB [Actinomycetota bacterium]
MVAEYEYLYALGFISGPEPKWTIFDPSDGKSVHSPTWDRAHLAHEAGSRLDVPSSQVLAILDAELDYLKMHGAVIRTVPGVEEGVPVVRASGDGLTAAIAVARELPEEIRRRVVTVEASTRNDVTLILKNGAEVLWGSAEEGPFKAEVLLVLLKEVDARFYDVSAPGVPATADTPR